MSGARADAVELARRYLAQRAQLAGEPWLLEGRGREAALEALRRRRPGSAGAPAGSGAETVDGDASTASEAGTSPDLASVGSLGELAGLVEACTRCPLHATRTNAVFGEGDPEARVVCVGEAPGAREDATGRPFVGRAGQLLDRLLRTIGLPRDTVYICNVLKSRPPNNRDPLPEEVEACAPYLIRQLELIRPEVILAFGAFASRTLLDTKAALGRLRGRVHEYAGFPVVVTYHPAALLRNPGWIRPTWEDLQIVRALLDGVGDG